MRFALFYHSLVSDWNHGNAHFLRGVAGELLARGHQVSVYESADAWSPANLLSEHGSAAMEAFQQAYPLLTSVRYGSDLDLDRALDGVDVVIVHEWNSHQLVARIGRHHAQNGKYLLFFHDTHHRAVTAPEEMAAYDLTHYDAVLAYGDVLRDIYLSRNRIQHAFVWHEAADTRVFHPIAYSGKKRDLVWIGNWGDEERTAELHTFLIRPAKALHLDAQVYGVRYPRAGIGALADAGIQYGGWLPNFRVPEIFARFRVTIHVPRLPYLRQLPGIPTIRPFEALACGIPLITATSGNFGGLFTPGEDFLVARNEREMQKHLRSVISDKAMARELAAHGLRTIKAAHTCGHRAEQLLAICSQLQRSQSASNVEAALSA